MCVFCDLDYWYQPLWKHSIVFPYIEGKREKIYEIGLEVWIMVKSVPDMISLQSFVAAVGWTQPHKEVS